MRVCLCYDSWRVMTYAKLGPNWITKIKIIAGRIFTRFRSWAVELMPQGMRWLTSTFWKLWVQNVGSSVTPGQDRFWFFLKRLKAESRHFDMISANWTDKHISILHVYFQFIIFILGISTPLHHFCFWMKCSPIPNKVGNPICPSFKWPLNPWKVSCL